MRSKPSSSSDSQNGLSFLVSYTGSKLIDEASSVFDPSILTGPIANFPVADSFNRKLEREVSNGDMPNVFVASFTYELPVGKGKRFNPGGITGKSLALSNWPALLLSSRDCRWR